MTTTFGAMSGWEINLTILALLLLFIQFTVDDDYKSSFHVFNSRREEV